MEWISVKDVPLPTNLNGDEDPTFLVSYPCFSERPYPVVVVAQYKFDDGSYFLAVDPAYKRENEHWDCDKIKRITHWMPLPEPPRGI